MSGLSVLRVCGNIVAESFEALTVFKGGVFDLIPNDGKRIETETLIGTSPLAPRLLRLLPVIPHGQHGPLQKHL